jgi:metal-responsive CopG/Arc/MetJ family transcriptional regulator
VLFAVPLLADAGRTVRINISLDKGLVDQIDAAASTRGLTRSAFIAQATREKIAG